MTELFQRSKLCIAQGALTNSKNPCSYVYGVYPTHIKYGNKAFLWDHAGKRYTDFICALGANLMGYGNPHVADAVRMALYGGWSHSLPTHYEVEAAEAVKTVFPWAESVKFVKTGTEACMASLKIARGHTNRWKVLSDGYHGWSDSFVSLTPPAAGVPHDPLIEKFADISQIDKDTAAVIVEPVIVDHSPARRQFLTELREACTKHGAMLIFDEVITGFRFQRHSVAHAWGIEPDLICFGKALAGGLPLSGVAGKYKLMENPQYFVSGTFAGEVLSLVAAKATIEALKKNDRYNIEVLWSKGQRFMDGFNAIAPDLVRIDGYPTRGAFVGDLINRSLFCQEAVKAGILFHPATWFFNWDLAENTDTVLNAVGDILGRIRRGEVRLEGDLPQSPFSMRARGQA